MKLYKNTLIISIIVFCVCIALSIAFEFTYISKFQVAAFLSNYMIGIACSIIVVIITTFLQFKYEQRKLLNSILSDVQMFFFHCLLIAASLDPNEKTPDKLWEYYYDKIDSSIRKISSQLSNVEWFSKKKGKISAQLHKAVLRVMIAVAKCSNEKNEDCFRRILDIDLLKSIKDNTLLLADPQEYITKKISDDFESIITEIESFEEIDDDDKNN